MVRRLGMKGSIPPTARRTKSRQVHERKVSRGINISGDCTWLADRMNRVEDSEVLGGLT